MKLLPHVTTPYQAWPAQPRPPQPGTTDLFEEPAPVSPGRVADAFERFVGGLVERLPNILTALAVLFLAWLLARLVRRGVETAMRRTSTEAHVHLLVGKLAHVGIWLLGLVVAFSVLGVNLAVLVGSLGLITVALGFALQDTIGNFVAGIVLLLEHPFTRGDYIAVPDVKGAEGTVEDIRIRVTQLRTEDGRQVLVPNKLLFNHALTNFSATMRRRVEVTLQVPAERDGVRVRQALAALAAEVEGVAEDPPPQLLVDEVTPDILKLRLVFWVDPRMTDLARTRSRVLERVEGVLGAGAAAGGEAAGGGQPVASPGA